MKYTVCAYYDTDLQKFYNAWLVPQILDDVIEGVMDSTKLGKIENAETKELFHLGSYDTADGSFDLLDKPVKVLILRDFVKKENA